MDGVAPQGPTRVIDVGPGTRTERVVDSVAPGTDPHVAPQGAPATPIAQTPPPPTPPVPTGPRYLPMAGGARRIAAKETDLYGPTRRAAVGDYAAKVRAHIQAANDHTQQIAGREYADALVQERKNQIRSEAADQAVEERAEDLEQRRADFDSSVRAMGRQHMAPDGGYWAKKTTPQKIGSIVSLMLGGFLQGARGGSNPAQDAINREIDREVRAQEMNYHVARDRVNATKSAFGMAMNKYRNVDAARLFARSVMLDTVKSHLMAQAAQWKGANAQRMAHEQAAAVDKQILDHNMRAIHFRPEQVVSAGPMWQDRLTGVRYNEAQMRKMLATKDEHLSKAELKKMDLQSKGVERQDKLAARGVELPAWGAAKPGERGEVVIAPSTQEAQNLRDFVSAAQRMERVAKRVKEIKARGNSWRLPSSISADARELDSLQSQAEMVGKNAEKLGVLAGEDLTIIRSLTGDVRNQVFGTEDIERYNQAVQNIVKDRVKGYPGSSDAARAQTPNSFEVQK